MRKMFKNKNLNEKNKNTKNKKKITKTRKNNHQTWCYTIQNITGRYFMGNLYVHRGASDNLLDIFDK